MAEKKGGKGSEVEDARSALQAKTCRRKRPRSSSRQSTPAKDETEDKRSEPAPLPTPSQTPTPTPMPAPRPLALLICSIGNPGSTYANTLHSAGHTVIDRLAQQLGYTDFQKDRLFANGLVSRNPYARRGDSGDWTLWRSTSYMNVSGAGVHSAWRTFSKAYADGDARLVVLHDELEKPLGAVTLKTTQGASARGHNGLKSIMGVIGKTPFMRIGVGIGRPASRQSDEVAGYVLKKMTDVEKGRIEESVEGVIEVLRKLEKG